MMFGNAKFNECEFEPRRDDTYVRSMFGNAKKNANSNRDAMILQVVILPVVYNNDVW